MAVMPLLLPSLSRATPVVNYTFSAGSTTTFTNGYALSGTMSVGFGGSVSLVSASLSVGPLSFTQADLGSIGQYSNVVCGSSRTFYEAMFSNSGGTLFLDFEQSNTTTPIPGSTGVHTSLTPNGGANVALSSTCQLYNDPAPASVPSGVLAATVATSNTPAQGAARAIDATPELAALFSGSDSAVSQSVTQTLPLLTGGAQQAAIGALTGINRVIQGRIEGSHGMSSGDGYVGDRHFWMKPFGSRAEQDARGGVSGYEADTYGLVTGLDGALSPLWRVGAAFAYANSRVDSTSSVAAQHARIDVYQLVGYGSYSLDARTEFNVQLDVGQNTNTGQRSIAFTGAVADSDYVSHTVHLGAGVGRSFALSERTSVTPTLRIDYTWVGDEAYAESGAGLLNLNVDSRHTDALVLGLGGKLSHKLSDQFTVTGNLGLGYDTINKQASITAAFAGAPGAAFVTKGIAADPWTANAGLGLVYETHSGAEFTARFDAEHRADFLNQTVSVKARWRF